MKINRIALKYF